MLLTEFVICNGQKTPVSELGLNSHKLVEVQCPVCGEVRTVSYSTYNANKHNDMCHHCILQLARKDIPIGTRFGRLVVIGNTEKDGMGYSVCQCDCGNVKTIKNTSLRRGHTVSCDCLRKERSAAACSERMKNLPPEKTSRYIDGRSLKKFRHEESRTAYLNFRQSIFDRDGRKCVICGSTKNIQTHHLYRVKDRPDLHTDPDNVVTVCKKCHEQYHHLFGNNKSNSPETFKQYAADNGVTL